MEDFLRKIMDGISRGWALVKANALAVVLGLIILLVLVPLSCLKFLSRSTYVNKEWGIQMACPSGWTVSPGKDKASVVCRKPGSSVSRKVMIKLEMKFGNPYGSDALGYIQNGLLPQIRYTYEDQDDATISVREPPFEVRNNKLVWAAMSFWVDMNELQVLRVAQQGERVYLLLLTTGGPDVKKDEEAFLETFDSAVIREVDSARVF